MSQQNALLALDFDLPSSGTAQDDTSSNAPPAQLTPIVFGEIEKHGGYILSESAGGLVFARFPNSADALNCAIGIQQAHEAVQSASRFSPRAGIDHSTAGDANEETDDHAFEAVRSLATLADPGGIRISRTVYDEVRYRIKLPYDTTRDPRQSATVCQEIRRNWDELNLLAASSVGIHSNAFRSRTSGSSRAKFMSHFCAMFRKVGGLRQRNI